MTQLLEEAVAAARALPPEDQDAVARALLADLVSERAVDARIAATPDALARLADEARAEYRAGRTEVLDPDRL